MTEAPPRRRHDELDGLLGALDGIPVIVHDRYLTVVGATRLARAVSPFFREGVNLARAAFLDDSVVESQTAWPEFAEHVAATLRVELDRHDADPEFRRLVGELSARSRAFARAFADDSGRQRPSGSWVFGADSPEPFTLAFHRLELPDAGDTVLVWRPDGPAAERALAAIAQTLPR
ncbi:hypothetical protein ITJ64_08785 [Herbiconiux sp. VKM Ac-1786]|uniref:MmyB family transcriptional regulator n=1 Tax=Herbiconiux sp. VKM Ac-1786 TaxID=2783824 RepID=UPI00188BA31F|nr:hypothetical protein [Herbiconiux sp. VKM Ac-1786]